MAFGGRPGIVNLGSIESAIARPYSRYYRPIHKKAAALLDSIVNNHGFTDGNKRTAWILVEILIERSGYYLNIPDDAPIDDIVVSVATGEMEFEAISRWFSERLSKH